ncbi:MAG TPA: hypothetical protein VNO31_47875 [Umezawaea sp.]|nr:hypothetical protein [Umezawaea sp.]
MIYNGHELRHHVDHFVRTSKSFGVVGFQSAELVALPVVGGFGDMQFPARVGDILVSGQQLIGLRQFRTIFSRVCRLLVLIVIKPFRSRGGPQGSRSTQWVTSADGAPKREHHSRG